MSVVKLEVTRNGVDSTGTGFVVHYHGRTCLVMTARHCVHIVHGRVAITVLLPRPGPGVGEVRFPGATVLRSGPVDLALLRLDNVVGEFRPMIFAEVPNVTSFRGVVVYVHGFYPHAGGTVVRPGRFPGHINGVYQLGDFTYLDGDFTSESGTSGGPVTMGDRVIGVNVQSVGGSRCAVSPLTLYMTFMNWCGFNGGDHTIAAMIQRLAA
ncbi:hypothetical protein CFC21_089316 [Triticum aestivum]|uniref:Serine protease n=2 Tax=Triticum aestivum TaxID=4565 RepID=A0A9R1LCM6_WHEAT|nr:putative protease Do-like 12, mitochondrial [Triticum dicoccoides]XP_044414206.1 putative protease Do-like 12, mitochondrial [Triticum aestivum]KAF7085957.1 hypothetical protein CFC21_089316 [Triticum aestivum]